MSTVDDLFATEEKNKGETISSPAETPAKKRPTSGKFCVLKQIGEGENASFIVVEESVEAPNRETAIKSVAITDDAVIEGSYVAIPLASWKVQQIKQTVRISLF